MNLLADESVEQQIVSRLRGSGANSVNKAARAEVVSRSHFTPRALLPRPVALLLLLG